MPAVRSAPSGSFPPAGCTAVVRGLCRGRSRGDGGERAEPGAVDVHPDQLVPLRDQHEPGDDLVAGADAARAPAGRTEQAVGVRERDLTGFDRHRRGAAAGDGPPAQHALAGHRRLGQAIGRDLQVDHETELPEDRGMVAERRNRAVEVDQPAALGGRVVEHGDLAARLGPMMEELELREVARRAGREVGGGDHRVLAQRDDVRGLAAPAGGRGLRRRQGLGHVRVEALPALGVAARHRHQRLETGGDHLRRGQLGEVLGSDLLVLPLQVAGHAAHRIRHVRAVNHAGVGARSDERVRREQRPPQVRARRGADHRRLELRSVVDLEQVTQAGTRERRRPVDEGAEEVEPVALVALEARRQEERHARDVARPVNPVR